MPAPWLQAHAMALLTPFLLMLPAGCAQAHGLVLSWLGQQYGCAMGQLGLRRGGARLTGGC